MSANLENSAVATDCKRLVFNPIPKKSNAKECSNYCTVAHRGVWNLLMRVLWTARRSVHSKGDQPWVFFGRNDAKAETPVLGHLMRRVDSLEKTLMLGGIEGRRKRG